MRKLKTSEIKSVREAMLKEQNGLCLLCNTAILDDAVLDHCHKSGFVRGVLHRSCNSALGSLENALVRRGVKDKQAFADGVGVYLASAITTLVHPTHKTPAEKLEAARKKRRKAKAKVR